MPVPREVKGKAGRSRKLKITAECARPARHESPIPVFPGMGCLALDPALRTDRTFVEYGEALGKKGDRAERFTRSAERPAKPSVQSQLAFFDRGEFPEHVIPIVEPQTAGGFGLAGHCNRLF